MPVRLKNNARALLVVSISELDPVIRVQAGKGDRFPTLGENEWFPLVLEDELGNMEITHAIARAGDVITVRRGQEGTTARSFGAGTLVSLRLTRQAAASWFSGEDPPPDTGEGDPDYGGTGLIFNGLVVNAYHTEEGRGGYFHPNSGTSEGQYLMAMACYQAVAAIKDYEADLDPDAPPLGVTGAFPRYQPGLAYEGRIQITNAIGACEVAQIGGDPLPPGATLRVDNLTKEVVVEWPAYAEIPGEPLPNGNFEEGDTGWIKGEGWSIEIAGGDNDGFGARVAVYRAQGFADLVNEHFRECVPGMRVAARVNVQQGASSAGHCGAGIGLKFYDENKEEIREKLGNQIWSGSKGRWHWSSITTRVPAGAAYMRAFIRGGRKRGYKPLWVDDASWDVPESLGTALETSYDLTLTVTDSEGRQAEWSGTIKTASPRVHPKWIVYESNTQPMRFYSDGDFSTYAIGPTLSDGYNREFFDEYPGGILFLANSHVTARAMSRDGGESWSPSMLIGPGDTSRSQFAFTGWGYIYAGAPSGTAWSYSTDNGATFTPMPGQQARAFIAGEDFVIKLRWEGGENSVQVATPDAPLAFSSIPGTGSAHSVASGVAYDRENNRVFWGSTYSESNRYCLYDGETFIGIDPVAVNAEATGAIVGAARIDDGWLVAHAANGVFRYGDDGSIVRVFTGNVTDVKAENGFAVLVVDHSDLYAATDFACSSWEEVPEAGTVRCIAPVLD